MASDVIRTGQIRPWRQWSSRVRAGWAAVGVVTVTSLALRLNSPTFVRPELAFDDAHFLRQAGTVLDGHWLGSYDKLTLSKGPSYPLFVAAVYRTGLPLKLAAPALHLMAAALIALVVWRLARSWRPALVTYAVVALDPAHLGVRAAQTSRENYYASLSLALVAGLMLLVLGVPALVRRGVRWSLPAAVVGGTALGVVAAAFHLCRDERLWIVPALLAGVVACLVHWRSTGDRPGAPHALLAAGMLVCAAAVFMTAVGTVAERNQAAYGTSVITDLGEGEIARAYAQWQRVDVGDHQRRVPVGRAQRQAVYAVSPVAAELEPVLEGSATWWFDIGCSFAGVCSDYLGAHFVWAMRDAAEATGHTGSGGESQRFFGRLADEIEAGCGDAFPCTPGGIGPMPPLARIDAGDVVASTRATIAEVLSYRVAEHDRPPSGQSADDERWDVAVRALRGIDDRAAYVRAEAALLDRQQPVAVLQLVYRWGARLGVLAALGGLVAGCFAPGGHRRPGLVMLGLVAAVAVASRIGFVALIDATSYPARGNNGYLLPCFAFLWVFVAVGVWLLLAAARRAVESRGGPPTGEADAPPAEPVEAAVPVGR